MKTTLLFLILFLTGLGLRAQTPPPASPDANAPAIPDSSAPPDEIIPPGMIDFASADLNQVLLVYEKLVGRTLLRAPGLPLTTAVVLKTVTPLTKSEAIEALQAVLSMNGIVVENIGDKFVKVLPADQAGGGGEKIDSSDASQLPELGTYVTHIVQLKYVKPSAMVPIITPFSKLANAVVPLDDNGILILRDNAENVKRMLELIAQVDIGGGTSEIISEVIPIRYALAEDIANALNSLGGSGGGSTVSIGGSTGAPTTGATRSFGGSANGIGTQGGINGVNQPRPFGVGGATGTTPNGTPAAGTTFQQRLLSIVNRASGAGGQQDQIQLFGQTKIIADQRSNSLLVFATRQDMDAITNVIAKLDVLLSQVLIESVIIDVNLTKALNAGVSVAQNPSKLSPGGSVLGAGGYNNGQSFYNFATGLLGASNTTASASSAFGNSLPGGLSYFGNIGPVFDVALQAAASDSTATVIQRPRIQTSQAKAASFFVGETVPYITSSYNGGAGIGQSSSYSQLSVGVSLDVTPFINPDGLVVMDIDQEIDDLDGSTPIEGVGNVPNTTKRTLQSEIAVKDKDTVMLGGFIRSEKDHTKNGIPYLQDIPFLGNLFTARTDNKDRKETIVLIRPTVLRTPDIAAAQAVAEQKRLPGISAAAAEDEYDERRQVDAEAKAEQKREDAGKGRDDNFFLPVSPRGMVSTNNAAPLNP